MENGGSSSLDSERTILQLKYKIPHSVSSSIAMDTFHKYLQLWGPVQDGPRLRPG